MGGALNTKLSLIFRLQNVIVPATAHYDGNNKHLYPGGRTCNSAYTIRSCN
jgi:hypothetical protein